MSKTFVVRDEKVLNACVDWMRDNADKAWVSGKPLQVDIGPEKKKRSLQANKLYWSLLGQVSEQAWIEGRQYAPEIFHELCKRRFIGCVDLPGGGLLGMSSSNLTSKEFAAYVDQVTAWAATEFGVTFLEPEP